MRLSRLNEPIIAVTMGDPAGIGPEVTLKALSSRLLNKDQIFLVIGDGSCLEGVGRFIKQTPPVWRVTVERPCSVKSRLKKNQINLLDLENVRKYQFGRNLARCGRAAVRYIDIAADLVKKELVDAIVTAPVNKKSINMAGVKFTGHTEYLAEKAGAKSVAMMFVGGPLKVVLATRHLPLKKVSSALTENKIVETTMLADKFMKSHFKKNPRIGLLGLNPHAGEGGLLGLEEKKIIAPAVKSLKTKISSLYGPLPADSAFYNLINGKFDLLVCMYHDQAMIPVKTLARNRAVNITLGLPYIRTSPVHGTAFDIAGKGIADPSSMIAALNLATRLIHR